MTDFAPSKSGLMLPANIADRPACAVCFLCGTEFTRPRDCERHMARCVKDNPDLIASLSSRRGPQDPSIWDTEYEQWARDGGTWENWYKEHRLNPDGTER